MNIKPLCTISAWLLIAFLFGMQQRQVDLYLPKKPSIGNESVGKVLMEYLLLRKTWYLIHESYGQFYCLIWFQISWGCWHYGFKLWCHKMLNLPPHNPLIVLTTLPVIFHTRLNLIISKFIVRYKLPLTCLGHAQDIYLTLNCLF